MLLLWLMLLVLSAVIHAGRTFGRRRRRRRRRLLFRFPLSRLDTVLSHRQRPVDAVKFVVKAARVAHRLAVVVPPPQRSHPGTAVRARQAQTSVGRLRKTKQN